MPRTLVRRHRGAVLLLFLPAVLLGCEPTGTVRAEAGTPPSLSRSAPAAPAVGLATVEAALADGRGDQAAAALMELLADADLPDPDLSRAVALADRLGEPNARRLGLSRRLERGAEPALPLRLELAAVLAELGDAAGAATHYEALIPELAEQDERLVLPLLESLARARTALGDHPGALALRRRALQLAEDLTDGDGEPALAARVDLARSLARLDRAEDLESLSGSLPAGPRRLLLEATHGLALERRGQHGLAVERLEATVTALSGQAPSSHPDLARARLALARARAADGAPQRAREDLTALLSALERDGAAPPVRWATQATLADLQLRAGEPAAARDLDRQRLADALALLPASHPLAQDALADLCWSLFAAGDRAGLPPRLDGLRDGTAALLDQLAGQSPERREQLLDQADAQLALVLALDLAGEAPVAPTWTLLETRHVRAGAASIRAASAADDPVLADRRQQLRASEARVEQLLGRSADGSRQRLLADALSRAAADRQAFQQALAERGLPVPAVDLDAVARALPVDGVYLALDLVDPTLPGQGPGAAQLLAHVLTPDGRTSRHLLAPLEVLERAARAWHHTGAPLQGPEHRELVALLAEPLAERTAGARRWWLRSGPGLPALPLEAFAGGAALSELPDLGPVLAPRPAWDLTARLVSAVLPDLGGQPAPDATRPAPGRSPALPISLSRASRELADLLGEHVLDLERRHEPRGGPVQRVSGPHATRATLGRLVAETRDVLLALPVWSGATRPAPSPCPRPSRSQQRRPRLEGSGADQGLALCGALLGRDELGRVPGLATLDDLSRLHLLAADLVCLPTPEAQRPALRQALHRAGARAVLMPLWPSPAQARLVLLDEVLRRHWEQGLPARQALREAQGTLLAAGHPPRDVLGWRLTAGP